MNRSCITQSLKMHNCIFRTDVPRSQPDCAVAEWDQWSSPTADCLTFSGGGSEWQAWTRRREQKKEEGGTLEIAFQRWTVGWGRGETKRDLQLLLTTALLEFQPSTVSILFRCLCPHNELTQVVTSPSVTLPCWPLSIMLDGLLSWLIESN